MFIYFWANTSRYLSVVPIFVWMHRVVVDLGRKMVSFWTWIYFLVGDHVVPAIVWRVHSITVCFMIWCRQMYKRSQPLRRLGSHCWLLWSYQQRSGRSADGTETPRSQNTVSTREGVFASSHRKLSSWQVYLPLPPCRQCSRHSALGYVHLWVSLCIPPKILSFVNTISQKPMKGISPKFGHKCVSVHRYGD